jgi:hypothetical protein
MLALLFVAVLIIPTIWLGLFIKWYKEDAQLKWTDKTEKIQILCQSPRNTPLPDSLALSVLDQSPIS